MQRLLPAHFCRGGTSKGLFLQHHALAEVSQSTRNRIILAAMGSPDPDGRQIDGMGGGISSLSKAAILHAPSGDHPALDAPNAFPGVSWANDLSRAQHAKTGWDVVYRFCQVGVREPELDWSSTCGNLVSAAAMTAVNWNLVQNKSVLDSLVEQGSNHTASLPVRILAANNGLVVTANVPVMLDPLHPRFAPIMGGDTVISGVPGTGAPIVIETPILDAPLRTGNPRDVITVDGNEIECSIIDTGLPVIFVHAARLLSLASSPHSIGSSPAALDTDTQLMSLIEQVRAAGATHAHISLSSATPKVCLVGPPSSSAVDLDIRAVSVGNIHRTVPATTLSALVSAAAIPGTIVRDLLGFRSVPASGDVVSLTVSHPAGTASASAKVGNIDGTIRPNAIVYTRTARLLFEGNVAVPEAMFHETGSSPGYLT